jgi:hypothetical protein
MKKHLLLKIFLSLIPALVFTQNWAWMTGNKIVGIAFLVFWVLFIWFVSKVSNKNKIIHDSLRISEIGFFLLPISALALTFILGSNAINTSTSGAEQAGAAIGTAIGGTFVVGIAFVIGLFGGIILHLISGRYGKKAEAVIEEVQPVKQNWFDKHRILTSILIVILLGIVAGATSAKGDKPVKNNSDQQSQSNADSNNQTPETAKPQEPAPVEIVKSSVSQDVIGTPQANLTVKNNSTKEVDGIKVTIKTFNNFGEPANGFLTDNTYSGISQEHIAAGKTAELSWTMYNYDTTSKIEPTITSIHFTDGTSWGSE